MHPCLHGRTVAEIPRSAPKKSVILVVDDEELVLSVTTRILERNGYEVMAASGGKEALKRIGDLSVSVNLVITDMMMPDMDGPTLVSLLRAGRPQLKIIGVSPVWTLTLRKEEMRAQGFAEDSSQALRCRYFGCGGSETNSRG